MQKWIPVLLLFLILTPYYILRSDHPYYVVALLLALLFVLFLRETKSPQGQAVALLVAGVLIWMHPEALPLTPLLFTAGFSEKNPVPATLFGLLCLFRMAALSPFTDTYILALLFVLALLLRIAPDRLFLARQRYYELYNDMQETKLRLEQTLVRTAKNKEQEVELALLTERNRITRDMHDGLGHILSRSILQIGAMETVSEELARAHLGAIRSSLEEGMTELRANLHNLKEEIFDLEREVKKLLHTFSHCPFSLTYTIKMPLSLNAAYSLLAILKEALNNIVKHSDAGFVTIKFLETKDRLFLTISDNGTRPAIRSYGIGLGSIVERAQALGGQAEFSTDHGFTVRVRIPKEAVHATAHH